MLTSRRDYILRLVDEVTRLLERLILQRRGGRSEEALESLMLAFERLFARDASQVFQLTPEEHYLLLAEAEPEEVARDKRLLYAALNTEAAGIYADLGRSELAQACRLNAIRFTLRASKGVPAAELPAYTPDVGKLLVESPDLNLDPETAELAREAGFTG